MAKQYILTGAAGHLGGTILRLLLERVPDARIRALIIESERERVEPLAQVDYIVGDVREPESLRPLFEGLDAPASCDVIHTAGLISIANEVSPLLQAVNVDGTRHVVELCRAYGVRRLLYVSSVHAIPESDELSVIEESSDFSASRVVGGYAKTKAEATRLVLEATRDPLRPLDAVVVHPSGILGPEDRSGNHIVQMLSDYILNRLPAAVDGGYDFVDVRDVAAGCLLALERGRSGECYILSNRHYEIRDLLRLARRATGLGRRLPTLPLWLARLFAPFIEWRARRRRSRPLYTRYSLHTLGTQERFSHDKATAELGYRPRDLAQTVRDTVDWVRSHTVDRSPRVGRAQRRALREAQRQTKREARQRRRTRRTRGSRQGRTT